MLEKFNNLIDEFSLISCTETSKVVPETIPGAQQNVSLNEIENIPLPVNYALQLKTACIPNPIEALINELKPMSID